MRTPLRVVFDRSTRTYAGDGEYEVEIVIRDAETRSAVGSLHADTCDGRVEGYSATLKIDGKVARCEDFDVERDETNAIPALSRAKRWVRENAGLPREVTREEAEAAVEAVRRIMAPYVGRHAAFDLGGSFSRQGIAFRSIATSCENFFDAMRQFDEGQPQDALSKIQRGQA